MTANHDIVHGFRFGAADVVRVCSDRDGSVTLDITTPRQTLTVRVTPSGLIRVGEPGPRIPIPEPGERVRRGG